jgi:hypothetical protein
MLAGVGLMFYYRFIQEVKMLKDKLIAVSNDENNRTLCSLGQSMTSMDKETLTAFVKAMKSNASSIQIMKILKEEGLGSFSMTHLRDKRRQCFMENSECFCIKEANNG